MEELKQSLRELAQAQGIELFGITPAERLRTAPAGFRPEDYLPGAKSVIVLGAHFPEASALFWERSPFPYQYYGYAIVNKELGHCAFKLSKKLEQAGYLALPFAPTVYPKDMDWKRQSGEISHRHAAVAAGLGEFGRSGLVLTREFGTRVRFISILTRAELPPDPPRLKQELCKKCGKCLEACPNRALQEEFEVSFEIEGTRLSYIQADKHRCYYNIMGLGPGSGGIINRRIKDRPGRLKDKDLSAGVIRAFLKKPSDFIVQLMLQHAVDWVDWCGRCLQVCTPNPNHLK